MDNPKNLFYSKEHEWAHINDEEVVIGITDYAQSQLGDVIFIEFPEIGDYLNVGASFGEVEAVKTVSDLFLPVSGEIIEFNENLDDNPELVNSDPYGEGWMIKLKVSDINDMNLLLSAEEYSELTQ